MLCSTLGAVGMLKDVPPPNLGSVSSNSKLWTALRVASQRASEPAVTHGPVGSALTLCSSLCPCPAALGLTEKLVKLNRGANAKLVSMGKSLQAEMESLLGPDGVLLYPSHPTVAPRHHSPLCMPFNFAYTGEQLQLPRLHLELLVTSSTVRCCLASEQCRDGA